MPSSSPAAVERAEFFQFSLQLPLRVAVLEDSQFFVYLFSFRLFQSVVGTYRQKHVGGSKPISSTSGISGRKNAVCDSTLSEHFPSLGVQRVCALYLLLGNCGVRHKRSPVALAAPTPILRWQPGCNNPPSRSDVSKRKVTSIHLLSGGSDVALEHEMNGSSGVPSSMHIHKRTLGLPKSAAITVESFACKWITQTVNEISFKARPRELVARCVE